MNDALKESVHLVGLARPLTAEPHLIRDMIDGKTEAAKENLVVRLFLSIVGSLLADDAVSES